MRPCLLGSPGVGAGQEDLRSHRQQTERLGSADDGERIAASWHAQKKKKKAVAVDLEDVATPTGEPSSTANNLAAAAGGPKVDKMGNTIAEEAPAEACVALLLHISVSCLR